MIERRGFLAQMATAIAGIALARELPLPLKGAIEAPADAKLIIGGPGTYYMAVNRNGYATIERGPPIGGDGRALVGIIHVYEPARGPTTVRWSVQQDPERWS